MVQDYVNGNGNIEEVEVTMSQESSINGNDEHNANEEMVGDFNSWTRRVSCIPHSVNLMAMWLGW